ncbi:UNVERIFIED_CONTAM: Small nuclear ribonucleoprotein E [Sesamum radiatum]|uniref:Small nuclear ribonucleoprotein E n=1 Tax=Sesamum radiatum TaxID=300843 RepID=A0AAW2NQY2_SESRA
MASTKVQRIMTQPINLIFRFLQSKARIQIWLFEQKDLRIEGRIIGFDEYMNLVLDDAEESGKSELETIGNGNMLLWPFSYHLTCTWKGPLENLLDHLDNPVANNAWVYATKFVPGS